MAINYVFPFDEETKMYAEKYLGETSEVREICITKIRQYLCETAYLNARSDDLAILTFLRICKFDVEKTKTKIKNFYEMRAKTQEWFSNRDPLLPEIKEMLNVGVFIPITQQVPGPLIVIIRTGAHDPTIHKQSDVFKAGKMILDTAVRQYESSTIYGVHAIFDMRNVTLWHAKELTPSVIQKAVFAWQNYNCRPQYLEFVHAPFYINVVLNIFKSFMSEKMKKRVHVHFHGYENLHKIINKNQLPVEYGGTNGELQEFIDYWRDRVLEEADWFKEDEQYKANLNEA